MAFFLSFLETVNTDLERCGHSLRGLMLEIRFQQLQNPSSHSILKMIHSSDFIYLTFNMILKTSLHHLKAEIMLLDMYLFVYV